MRDRIVTQTDARGSTSQLYFCSPKLDIKTVRCYVLISDLPHGALSIL